MNFTWNGGGGAITQSPRREAFLWKITRFKVLIDDASDRLEEGKNGTRILQGAIPQLFVACFFLNKIIFLNNRWQNVSFYQRQLQIPIWPIVMCNRQILN